MQSVPAEGENLQSSFDRDWGFDTVSSRIGADAKVVRVLHEDPHHVCYEQGSIKLEVSILLPPRYSVGSMHKLSDFAQHDIH